jgi:sulfite exporter TauE/SafE
MAKSKGRRVISFRVIGVDSERIRQYLVKNLSAQEGIYAASVSVASGSAAVSVDAKSITEDAIFDFVNRLGYQIDESDKHGWPAGGILGTAAALSIASLGASRIAWRDAPHAMAAAACAAFLFFGMASFRLSYSASLLNGLKAEGERASIPFFGSRLLSLLLLSALAGALGRFASLSAPLAAALRILAGALIASLAFAALGGRDAMAGRARLAFAVWARRLLGKVRLKKSGLTAAGMGAASALTIDMSLMAMLLACFSSLSVALSVSFMACYALGTLPALLIGSGKRLASAAKASGLRCAIAFACGIYVFALGSSALFSVFLGAEPARAALSAPLRRGSARISSEVQSLSSVLEADSLPDIAVTAGSPVEWTIHCSEGALNACNSSLSIPEFGIKATLHPGDNVLSFTPLADGVVGYSCWLGQVKGTITIQPAF